MLTIKRLDLADARILIEGAAEKAREIGVPMCIAVVDESGNLVAFERMDGGKITSVTIAQDKAFTAAAAKKATHDYNKVNVPGSLAFGIHTEGLGKSIRYLYFFAEACASAKESLSILYFFRRPSVWIRRPTKKYKYLILFSEGFGMDTKAYKKV